MERVSPHQVNYDNVLPLAIESRSNRREFLPVNGQTFSNTNGSTVVRIDINADSMLDATHSYLEYILKNTNASADSFLAVNPFTPSWIQRLRIESGGVVVEDINEYSRLYAMLSLNQCPKDYIMNNMSNQGLYNHPISGNLQSGSADDVMDYSPCADAGVAQHVADSWSWYDTTSTGCLDLVYPPSAQGQIKGVARDKNDGVYDDSAQSRPSAVGLSSIHTRNRIGQNRTRTCCIPLVSGFLNMDKYIPLIMMNAGFTLELTLCDANRIGITQDETSSGNQDTTLLDSSWEVSGVKYVAHLIDLDRSFYDKLRAVMEGSGGVLQLAGQTYRHYVGSMPSNAGPHTITLPARVKSVKSIFGTFIESDQMGVKGNFDTSVFQNAALDKYRFEIGSVRYPQTDVNAATRENEVELQKAWGKLGDYQHQQAYKYGATLNIEEARTGISLRDSALSAYFVGYDFEAFQRVALEAGINTADRSLPINFIASRTGTTTKATRCDFYVLTDAIYYINLDGTVSVSV